MWSAYAPRNLRFRYVFVGIPACALQSSLQSNTIAPPPIFLSTFPCVGLAQRGTNVETMFLESEDNKTISLCMNRRTGNFLRVYPGPGTRGPGCIRRDATKREWNGFRRILSANRSTSSTILVYKVCIDWVWVIANGWKKGKENGTWCL